MGDGLAFYIALLAGLLFLAGIVKLLGYLADKGQEMRRENMRDCTLTEIQKEHILADIQGELSRLPAGSDFGDLGNLFGMVAAKAAKEDYSDDLEQIKKEFLVGAKHGFMLMDGTH
ncbi:hypothetical protein [Sedimenticola hydrogenitrophicus]|uniref:hypothetical protein n=1 Tax=Sedimenticola hydrogenitrophicus TaxID=2967975 RepID=UPI0023AF1858|nr:hypothetical protein [Sedimenticola hydrogenitrophicus]